jgi:hypothetical protein
LKIIFLINITTSSIAHARTTAAWNDCPNPVSLWSTVDTCAMNVAQHPLGGIKSDRHGRQWSSDFLPKPRSRSAQPMLRWFHVVYTGNTNIINIYVFLYFPSYGLFFQDICGIICAIFTWLLILYAEFVVTFVTLLPCPYPIFQCVNMVIFQIFAFLAMASHLRTMFTDPVWLHKLIVVFIQYHFTISA